MDEGWSEDNCEGKVRVRVMVRVMVRVRVRLRVRVRVRVRVRTRTCLLYTSPSPRDGLLSRMPSSA